MAAKRAVRHRVPADLVEGSAPVCPTCGAPLTFTTDPLGYGTTMEQCSRGFPTCEYFRPLGRRVRPELARVPTGLETRRVRRSKGSVPPPATPATRRPLKALTQQRVLLILPIDALAGETPVALAVALRLSVGCVKSCLTQLRAEGRADYRVRHILGKTGRPAHVWWRVA